MTDTDLTCPACGGVSIATPPQVVAYLKRNGWTVHMTTPDRWLFLKEPRIVEVPRVQDNDYQSRFAGMVAVLARVEKRSIAEIVEEMSK